MRCAATPTTPVNRPPLATAVLPSLLELRCESADDVPVVPVVPVLVVALMVLVRLRPHACVCSFVL